MKELIEMAARKGFKTLFHLDKGLWVIGFIHNGSGKWSPPYSGFTLDEARQEAMEDLVNVKGE